jgi:hypothetical protein
MAKRTVYICDTPDCGAVLVHPEDGFVITGVIKTTTIDGEAKVLVGSIVTQEISLCAECFNKAVHKAV